MASEDLSDSTPNTSPEGKQLKELAARQVSALLLGERSVDVIAAEAKVVHEVPGALPEILEQLREEQGSEVTVIKDPTEV